MLINHLEANKKPPKNIKEALFGNEKENWKNSCLDEINSMIENEVYEVIDNSHNNVKVVDCRWVFAYKYDENGNIIKYKARLVAKGFTQIEGIDYFLTYAPTLKVDTFRIMIKLASINKWNIYQLDINCAYLNGKLKEDIYMKIPYFGKGYKEPNKIWKLKRSIYGLKQSTKVWNNEITKTICNMGLKQSNLDPCVFFYFIDDILNGVIMIYVDDILIIGKNSFIKIVKNEFFNKYKCIDIGFAKYILGVEIIKNDLGNYSLSQKAYIEKMIDRYLDVYSQNNNKIGSPGTIYNKDEVDGEDVNPLYIDQLLEL